MIPARKLSARPSATWVSTGHLHLAGWQRHRLLASWLPRQVPAAVNSAAIQVAYIACVMADEQITADHPREPDVRALLERHREFALAQTPPEHSFALDLDKLPDPAVTFFGFRAHGTLPGIGAIKCLSPDHAEIKPMHTAEAARGRGTGRATLTHLLEAARTRGLRRVSRQTGTTAAFAPARALYRRAGFILCGPFAGYQPSEDNPFMTMELDAVPPGLLASRARTRSGPVIMGATDQTTRTRQTATRNHEYTRDGGPSRGQEHDRSPRVKLSPGS